MTARVSTMDVTPKKLLNRLLYQLRCSLVTSKQRVRVFKSGSKGTSSVDLHRLINKQKQGVGHRRKCLLELRHCSMH